MLFQNYCIKRTSYTRLCRKYSSLIADKYLEIPRSFNEKDPKLIDKFKKRYVKRQKKRKKLIKELVQASKGQKRYEVLGAVNDFLRYRFKPKKKLSRIKGYKPYRQALGTFYADIRAIHQSQNSLSKLNFKGVPVMLAQLTHGDLFHLASNMFLVVVLGVFLEQRLSFFSYLLIYLLGGSFAVTAHTVLATDPTIPLVGASGNVSAVLGAFWIFFYNFSMRLYIPFLTGSEKIFLPVKLTVPFLFLMGDVVGYLGNQNLLLDGGRVGHMAHLSGFFLGASIAITIKAIFKLPWPFIAPSEIKELKALEQVTNLDEKLARSSNMLASNRDNIFVMTSTIGSICRAMLNPEYKQRILENPRYKNFIEHGLKVVCTLGIRFGKENMVCHFLNSIPMQVPLSVNLTDLGQENMLYLADCALFFGYPTLSLRLYEAYMYRYQGAKQAPLVALSVRSLLSMLPKNREWNEVITILKAYSSTSEFISELDHFLGVRTLETA
ncbi:MAG: rhomboid family intramembrane serine protease [Oligoflexales bacterium]|nr:rhomboid family intramembrane serine protease [Oligoflexales bacterium]